MPLITQGKTNLKYVLIVGVFAIAAGIVVSTQGETIRSEISRLATFTEITKSATQTESLEGADVLGGLSFSPPVGWKKISQEEFNSIEFFSPEVDLSQPYAYVPDMGAELRIVKSPTALSEAECDKSKFPESYVTDFKCTTVGGRKAESYHVDYEGHSLNYIVVYQGFNYSITLGTRDLSEEMKYINVFEQFLGSVKFGFVPSDVEGWKTYRNEEYGFEVKYPEDFIGIKIVDDALLTVGHESQDNDSAELFTIKILPKQQFNAFETSDGISTYQFKFSRGQGEWDFVPSNYSSEDDLKTALVPVTPNKYITSDGLITYVGGAGTSHGTQGGSVSEVGLIENSAKNLVVEITITRCWGIENSCGIDLQRVSWGEHKWVSNEKTIFSVLNSFRFE